MSRPKNSETSLLSWKNNKLFFLYCCEESNNDRAIRRVRSKGCIVVKFIEILLQEIVSPRLNFVISVLPGKINHALMKHFKTKSTQARKAKMQKKNLLVDEINDGKYFFQNAHCRRRGPRPI